MENKPVAIEVSNLSKEYEIGKAVDGTLRGSIGKLFKGRKKTEKFSALKDVSFSVKQGEIVGIIGKNGAGKSTLLKVLSQITRPSNGRIELTGRLASLLEVGTGFHPELTGRENVFLNGTILGMSRKEVAEKFDEIVAFSGVEKFLDTPVKHYSSGMYVRLAFAVAAHLEPEILVIDEVLAVGDAEFQKKCLGKMRDVSSKGRTVLFVSHNIAAVRSLCTAGIVLEHGRIVFQGGIEAAIECYQAGTESGQEKRKTFTDTGNEFITLNYIEVLPAKGTDPTVSSGLKTEIGFSCHSAGINLDCTIELRNVEETIVFHTGALISVNNDSQAGDYSVNFEMPAFYLNAGRYSFNLIFGKNQREALFSIEYCYFFDIENDTPIGNNSSVLPGVLRPNFDFNIQHRKAD